MGIVLSLPAKEVVMHLKQLMQDDRMYIPSERELLNELDVERYEPTGLSAH